MIRSADFVAAVALQNIFPLSSKIFRNPGSMPRAYTNVLSTSGKYMAGFLVKSFGGCYGSAVLMGASCWQSSNCNLAQKIVSLSMELNHIRAALMLDSDNDECCHHSSHNLYQGSPNYGPRAKPNPPSHFTRSQNALCQ